MEQSRRQPPARPKDPAIAVLEPAFKVGAACGTAGFLVGGASGIIRGVPPVLFGGIAAVQTFALGSTFTALRSTFIHAWTTEGQTTSPLDLTKASALAGGLSGGALGFLSRGRANVIPGAVMIAIFGALGQHISNQWTKPQVAQPKDNFWKRMGEKSWMPFKVLSNEEYAEMLQEKLLKVDVEIAILDDKVAALKDYQSQIESEEVAAPKVDSKL